MKKLTKILALAVLAVALTSASAFALRIDLHNNDAESEPNSCPEGQDNGCWHFIIAPNDDSQYFNTITLALDGSPSTFTFSQSGLGVDGAYILNGTQTDNVFVPVPVGYSLTDLLLEGSWADIIPGSWTKKNGNIEYAGFILSHTCPPTTVPEPATLFLLGTGLIGLGFSRKRMK